MASTFIVASVLKLAGACGVGIGASTMFKFFHDYEFNFKKKGDKNATNHSELLRDKAKGLS